MLRTFVAIELPGRVREALERHIRRLRQQLPGSFRWVKPESVHLTLKFLGDIEEAQASAIAEALRRSLAGHPQFDLRTGRLGCFPNAKRPRVVWMGVEGDLDALAGLQLKVEEACTDLGFEREKRRFVPHLTLGRASRSAPVSLDKAPGESEPFTVTRISLMKSELTPGGAVHTRLDSFELVQNAQEMGS